MQTSSVSRVAIIGGGPAGLMAAEALSLEGIHVDLFDAMPSVGRKLLLAGVGGLNITHNEDYTAFCQRFGQAQTTLQPSLDQLSPHALRQWVHALGIDTFVGSSGRVFPKEMKAAPLLRAWLHRLRSIGVHFHVRHKWLGWSPNGALRFSTPTGHHETNPTATLFALGGASWPKLGSNGTWVDLFRARNIDITPLQSANCGFDIPWSVHLQTRFSGTPLKSVALHLTDAAGISYRQEGECLITQTGIEGSLIYALSRPLRNTLNQKGVAQFNLDLAPGLSEQEVLDRLCRRGTKSLTTFLKSALGFSPVKIALIYEVVPKTDLAHLPTLAGHIKALAITTRTTRPLDEAISTAGGISLNELDEQFMLKKLPGVFIAGEMLDWEAPTGGYLLTGCWATGLRAGQGAARWIKAQPSSRLFSDTKS